MDRNRPSNYSDMDEAAIWAIFMSTLYCQITDRQMTIRYDSRLTGHDRVAEFLDGHWERIFNRTRMARDCFNRFVGLLEGTGRLRPSRSISVSEQVMIFLYVVGHAASNRDSQEVWQHSGSTVSKYFGIVLQAIFNMSAEFITPLDMNNVHPSILYNNRFFPYFQGCVGAIDGTHISANVKPSLANKFRGRKRDTTWNIMAACDFDLKFTYMLSGWEGSAHDARVLSNATTEPHNNFPFPPTAKYYLVDSGYANKEFFLAPYRGQNYHLNDRRRQGGDKRKEQFNYRHASLRNAIERTFGIWKRRFPILKGMPRFPMDKQTMIPIACAVVHNFIRMNTTNLAADDDIDDDDTEVDDDDGDDGDSSGDEAAFGKSSHQGDNEDNGNTMQRFRDFVADCIEEDNH